MLAVMVTVGSFWTEKLDVTVAVYVAASPVLLVIGLVMVITSRLLRRRRVSQRQSQETPP